MFDLGPASPNPVTPVRSSTVDAPAETRSDTDQTHRAPGARAWVLALVAWSLLVWATRIDNILADESLDGGGQAWRIALSMSFVVLAVAAGWRWRRRGGLAGRPVVARALAAWTIVVWVVRGIGITLGDHDLAFIVVHLVLAVVSIVLGAIVLRTLSARTAPPS